MNWGRGAAGQFRVSHAGKACEESFAHQGPQKYYLSRAQIQRVLMKMGAGRAHNRIKKEKDSS